MDRVLVISAHPDDLELSCSGTVAKFIDEGFEVTNLVMNGNLNHVKYLDTSSDVLGFNYIVYPNDSRFTVSAESVGEVESIINVEDYDIIITHWKEDWHQDHRACYELTNILVRNYPITVWYMSAHPYSFKYKEFDAQVYVDISDYVDLKYQAIGEYKNLKPKWLTAVMAHDSWRGSYINTESAEVFHVGNIIL
jgi:LmbE family N-acetylglucosaminyl deacetylase